MSDAKAEDAINHGKNEVVDEEFSPEIEGNDEKLAAAEEHQDSDVTAADNSSSSAPIEEETIAKKKYGGLLRKKPLISKDHEHAFFDSADWVLGKQGAQKNKGPLEPLRPKLEPTPHHQAPSRRPSYTAIDIGEECVKSNDNCNTAEKDQIYTTTSSGGNKRELSDDYSNQTQ